MNSSNDDSLHAHDCKVPGCQICALNKSFVFPRQLIEAFKSGNLVLFAGGGISTETKHAFPSTFYENIHQELKLKEADSPSFPELMDQYCGQPNGRSKLLMQIKERIDYGYRFPEVFGHVTKFHHELSTIPFLDEIYTTNWDDFFESICHATPFVSSDDFAFWHLPERKVFKIHGSIRNLGSIVATTADYNRCYRNLQTGLLGSQLKLALATKTVVFVGYSLRDEDFLRIWKLVYRELRDLIPAAYWVTLSPDPPKSVPSGLIPIETDATYFLRCLKSALVADGIMVADENWARVMDLRIRVSQEHFRLSQVFRPHKNPEMIYALVYQDGLTHACDWLIAQATAGKASHRCYVVSTAKHYEKLRRDYLAEKRYVDVAYIEGFLNGLIFGIATKAERRHIPLYFLFGADEDLTSLSKYRKWARHAESLHKAAYKSATRVAKHRLGTSGELAIHHTPFL